MSAPPRRRPSPATAISVAALVFAMAGGAVAAVNGSEIVNGTVTTAKLANGAVTTGKIRSGAVTTSKIAAGAVGTSAIASGAVTASDIATGAVSRAKIAKRAVTGSLIATGTITSTNIVPAGITRSSLAADARIPTVVTRFVVQDVPINTTQSITAPCNPGETAVGGGYAGLPGTVQGGGTQANVLASRPDPLQQGGKPTGWFVVLENLSTSLAQASVYALCATSG